MRLKHTKQTGKTTLEYLSMSEGDTPNNSLMFLGRGTWNGTLVVIEDVKGVAPSPPAEKSLWSTM